MCTDCIQLEGENNPSNRSRKEIGIAKISLTIAVVFIVCHSIKWIPNIHEIIMVRNRIYYLIKKCNTYLEYLSLFFIKLKNFENVFSI